MSEITIEKLMEHAQCFASTSALVGTPFDSGHMQEQAETEKALLQEMLEEFESDASARLHEIADGLVSWHESRVKNFRTILDAPDDTEIRLGAGDDAIIVAGDQAKWFRIGMTVALEWIEKLPLSITRNAPSDEEE